jgi:NAD-dependent SIR2 family protein deacetylase
MGQALERAADAIAGADAILVGAGAGMGVDSGLPDFRGTEGFWEAYPPMARLGIAFEEMANPAWFQRDPELAWGFYGHRLNLYRATVPHGGFSILRRWGEEVGGGVFVFTSNVDGQFGKAGFYDNVVECHGSIHHLQCTRNCDGSIWEADSVDLQVDEATFRATPPLPSCPRCGSLARPNVLMFGDWGWIPERTHRQETAFTHWLSAAGRERLAVIECGAGSAVPTVRWRCERAAAGPDATLIRINPREPEGPPGTIEIASGALAALDAIEARLST